MSIVATVAHLSYCWALVNWATETLETVCIAELLQNRQHAQNPTSVAGQGGSGVQIPEVRRATPVNHANPKIKFCPTPPPPQQHILITSKIVMSRKFSVYLNGGKEVDGAISEFSSPIYTIQPVVNPVWQPVVSCKRGISYPIIPTSESCCVIGNLAAAETGDYAAFQNARKSEFPSSNS